MNHPSAPLGRPVRWTTAFVIVLICAAPLYIRITAGTLQWPLLLTVLIVPAAAAFMVRGYSIQPGMLLVHRPFWVTRITLRGTVKACSEPRAMRRSLRLCGNGGLLSVTGYFRNRDLGIYRAFVTDSSRCVVLRHEGRPVVVSPASPDAFLREIDQLPISPSPRTWPSLNSQTWQP